MTVGDGMGELGYWHKLAPITGNGNDDDFNWRIYKTIILRLDEDVTIKRLFMGAAATALDCIPR